MSQFVVSGKGVREDREVAFLNCRAGCGACCIAASIRSGIPGMREGKPAGQRCIHLDDGNLCRLWGTAAMPAFCRAFTPAREVCGDSAEDALWLLSELEISTAPDLFATTADVVGR